MESSYPPEVEECQNPQLRAEAIWAIEKGTEVDKGNALRKIYKYNADILASQREKKQKIVETEWSSFLSSYFRYISR
jgi:hypothetical protein